MNGDPRNLGRGHPGVPRAVEVARFDRGAVTGREDQVVHVLPGRPASFLATAWAALRILKNASKAYDCPALAARGYPFQLALRAVQIARLATSDANAGSPSSRAAYRSRGCTPAARACPVVKVDGSSGNLLMDRKLDFSPLNNKLSIRGVPRRGEIRHAHAVVKPSVRYPGMRRCSEAARIGVAGSW